MERNTTLQRENDVLRLLLIDLFRGEAALQTQGVVTWLISRPGAADSGCAAVYTNWGTGDSLDIGTIDDLVRQTSRARFYAYTAEPEDRERLMVSGAMGGQVERIARIGMADNCAPKLPCLLGDFHRVKLTRVR